MDRHFHHLLSHKTQITTITGFSTHTYKRNIHITHHKKWLIFHCSGFLPSSSHSQDKPHPYLDINTFYLFFEAIYEKTLIIIINSMTTMYKAHLFRISVEVEIYHHLPRYFSGDGTPQSEHLSSQEPPRQTDSVDWLVVGGDSDVDVSQWGVRVTQSNDRDVNIGCLSDSLMISSRVCDNQQTWLTVVLLLTKNYTKRHELKGNSSLKYCYYIKVK